MRDNHRYTNVSCHSAPSTVWYGAAAGGDAGGGAGFTVSLYVLRLVSVRPFAFFTSFSVTFSVP
eukprot:m.433623 g.433623  ORF g.433623 m.433623 type:complete len:64 (-) comp17597_c0_seq1:1599-1790(-)